MTKILILTMLSVLIIGCSSDKEALIVVQEETSKKASELTKLDKCLLKVGMQDESTTTDMSIPDLIERELTKMDVATLKGSDYNGYDHECIDEYIEYVKEVSGDYVADYSDLGKFDSEFDSWFIDDIDHDDNRELNVCMAHAGIKRVDSEYKTFELDKSLMSMAANEIMAVDRDTGMGQYFDDFEHDCLDLYKEYTQNDDIDPVERDEHINYDAYDDIEVYSSIPDEAYNDISFKVTILEHQSELNGYYYSWPHIDIISTSDSQVTINKIIINRNNAYPCQPQEFRGSNKLNYGGKFKVVVKSDCNVNDILDVEIVTSTGSITYSFY